MLSDKDNVQSSLSLVGLVFDGNVCGCLLCMLSGRRREFSEELIVLSVWGDVMEVGVDADNSFNNTLVKIKDGGRPSPWKVDGLLMVG